MSKVTCFISFSREKYNMKKLDRIFQIVSINNINYSERVDKRNYSDVTIWKYLYDRISGSSCTILFLTRDLLEENRHKIEYKINDFIGSGWVYNEISASLRNHQNNRINGIVCVVDDDIFSHNSALSLHNFYESLPEILKVNSEYIVFVNYFEFITNSNKYITKAIKKREEQISRKKDYKIRYDLHSR